MFCWLAQMRGRQCTQWNKMFTERMSECWWEPGRHFQWFRRCWQWACNKSNWPPIITLRWNEITWRVRARAFLNQIIDFTGADNQRDQTPNEPYARVHCTRVSTPCTRWERWTAYLSIVSGRNTTHTFKKKKTTQKIATERCNVSFTGIYFIFPTDPERKK